VGPGWQEGRKKRRAWVARRRRSGVGWRERTDDEPRWLVVVVAGVCWREGTTWNDEPRWLVVVVVCVPVGWQEERDDEPAWLVVVAGVGWGEGTNDEPSRWLVVVVVGADQPSLSP
jgi:hypothetical protein